ncbi:PREDICTED: DNA-directed RNA polymerases IV and V subunit 4 isoform X2 [Nelumbo nucifera]|uniref:DNA-directed RNA polymerases IV and V subunit 4 isoform X2 n=1 Tax=Nelumbo nucifera TaxID=4432 RepID=A0A1U7ZG78_NELNU|nr:PREDICTED: DNA-directed RNA polymerases IV and V subunit 4 isoform X2 [Nelumbo nucifera]
MAGKGEKGFNMKSSLKSSSGKKEAAKGKDGTSSKKGRTIRFDTSDPEEAEIDTPLKSGGKVMPASVASKESSNAKISNSSKSGGKFSFGSPVSKGDWGKGGKGDKTVKASGKSTVSKGPTIPELKIEDELPKNTECLLDCEAAIILQGIQEQLVILSEDPTFKMPTSFDNGLQYAKTSNQYTSHTSVQQVLEPLKRHGVSDGEMCMIGNIFPETVDEVFALIPSLKGKRQNIEEPMKDVVYKLANLRHSK